MNTRIREEEEDLDSWSSPDSDFDHRDNEHYLDEGGSREYGGSGEGNEEEEGKQGRFREERC